MKGYRHVAWFGLLLCFHMTGWAAVLNDCDEASLRTAMAGGGVITFGCDGTIVLSNTLIVTADTTLDARGRDVTLSGNGQVRILAGTNRSLTLFNLMLLRGADRGTNGATGQVGGEAGGAAILLRGGQLQAENCRFLTNRANGGTGGNGDSSLFVREAPGGRGRGGAILVDNAGVSLINCLFLGNGASGGNGGTWCCPLITASAGNGEGGAVWIGASQAMTPGADLVISGCRFEGNAASRLGGALYVLADGIVTNCAFNQNSASGWDPYHQVGGGAALYYSGPAWDERLSVIQCVFSTNTAGGRPARGGAILHADRNLEVLRCTFTGNAAFGMAGQPGSRPATTLHGGTGEGGGLCSLAGNLMLGACTFSGNRAIGGDGALFPTTPALPGHGRGAGSFIASTGTVRNCTFTGNAAAPGESRPPYSPATGMVGEGGGICVSDGSTLVAFSTIASNAVTAPTNNVARGAGCSVTGGTLILDSSILAGNTTNGAFGQNLFGSVSGGESNMSSDSTGGPGRFNLDPRLDGLRDNGGPVPTMALHRDSPAIDTSTSPNRPATDARGVTRPQGRGADIGAYEQTFLTIARSAGGARISYAAPPLEQYALEGSTDLSTWSELQTGASDDTGRLTFDVLPPPPSEMFRLRLIP